MKKLVARFKQGGRQERDLKASSKNDQPNIMSRTSSKIVNQQDIASTKNWDHSGIKSNLDEVQTYSGFDDWLTSFKPAGPVAAELHGDIQPSHRPAKEVPASPTLPQPEIARHKNDDLVTIVLENLRKVRYEGSLTEELVVPIYITLEDLNQMLMDNGYQPIVAAKRRGVTNFTPEIDYTVRAMVTRGPSRHSKQVGLCINENETFGAYFKKMQNVRVERKDSSLFINDGELKVSFKRTLRLPDDEQIYDLPKQLGDFPVYSMSSVANMLISSNDDKLISIAKKGGAFLPLYQREALWISFKATHPFAIRVFVGGVNAVSGRHWKQPRSEKEQDYIVAPLQTWLDGIVVDAKTVRQFVAMPMGSGYSVEKQVTGKEDVGGFQLEIVPATQSLFASRDEDFGMKFDETSTARNEDIQPGDCLKIGGDRLEIADRFLRSLYVRGQPQPRWDKSWRPWRPGNTLHMTAIYDTKVTFRILDLHTNRVVTEELFECPSWKSCCELIHHINKEDLEGYNLEDCRFYHNNITINGEESLEQNGIKENDIVTVGAASKQKTRPFDSFGSYQAYSRPAPQWQGGPAYEYQGQGGPPVQRQGGPAHQWQGGPAYEYQEQGGPHFQIQGVPPVQSQGGPPVQSQGGPPVQSQGGPPVQSHGGPRFQMQGQGGPRFQMQGQGSPRFQMQGGPASQGQGGPPASGWDMGIGAGARIHQKILLDPYPPDFWTSDGSVLVNVQILNSATFELVTGMVPPPTPINVKTYMEAGIPFYTSYSEEAATTEGEKNFKGVRSVGQLDASGGPIEVGTSMAGLSHKVACIKCTKNMCDCILRPCNHAFCVACVEKTMTTGKRIVCGLCHRQVGRLVGFSAPMSLPGEETIDLDSALVHVLLPMTGAFAFKSANAELEGDYPRQAQQGFPPIELP